MESGSDHHQNQEEKEREEFVRKEAEETNVVMVKTETGEEEGRKEDADVSSGKNILMEDVKGDPTDDIMIDIDSEDLIFSDDGFHSLPDFPCLSSPSASPSPSSASTMPKNPCLSSSSSTSSSSSSWPFLTVTGGGEGTDMQQQHSHAIVPSPDDSMIVPTPSDLNQTVGESEEIDLLGDIDLWDPSDPWDPSSLIPDYDSRIQEPQHEKAEEEEEEEDQGPSEDLAKVFMDWLKSNKDSISPEDLRNIKLKRSTIECAAARLGAGKEGKLQLLKLILAWVQNNHLQKKRRRQRGGGRDRHDQEGVTRFPFHRQQQQHPYHPPFHQPLPVISDGPINPNPNLDYNYDTAAEPNHGRCNSLIHYPVDPMPAPTFPSMMMSTGVCGDPVNQSATGRYHYYQSGSTSSIVVNSQPFSPSPDFHAFSPTPMHYSPFPVPALPHPHPIPPPPHYPGGYTNQYPGQPQPLYQLPSLTGMASATKEARKKRMARQRRFSTIHHHRSQNHDHHHHNHHQHRSHSTEADEPSPRPMSEGGSTSSQTTMNWAFWPSPSPSPSPRQLTSLTDAHPPPVPLPMNLSNMQLSSPPPVPALPPAQQQNFQRCASSSDRRQGWKAEKNLRFLLQKVLKQSDVGSLGRIVLPKKEAEIHLPELDARDGISIPMEDIGTSRIWNMRYRFWPNNKSRMYLLENTGDFVRSNGLQEGDFIVIYSDVKCSKYMIRGVKVRQPPAPKRAGSRNAGKAHQKKSNNTSKTKALDNNYNIKDETHSTEEGGVATPSMTKTLALNISLPLSFS